MQISPPPPNSPPPPKQRIVRMYNYEIVIREGDKERVLYEASLKHRLVRDLEVLAFELIIEDFTKMVNKDRSFDDSMQSLIQQQPKKKQGFFRKLVTLFTGL